MLLTLGRLAEELAQAQHMWYPPAITAKQYVYLRKAFFASADNCTVTFRYMVLHSDFLAIFTFPL